MEHRTRLPFIVQQSGNLNYEGEQLSSEPTAINIANAKAAAELNRRRERNREHQAKYKKKQKQRVVNLESDIQQLQHEIHALEMQQTLLLSAPSTSNVWSVAAEYFRLFSYGVQTPATTLCPYEPHVQRNFLQITMVEDVTDGSVCGINSIMDNWMRMSFCNPGLEIELVRLENGLQGLLVASIRQHLTITKSMVHSTFPSLVADDGNASIVHKLLGKSLVLVGSVHFKWNESINRIESFEFKADMITPLLKMLGSLDDVSRVFHNARLTPECGLVF
ncbi:hypothetical protein DVH05_014619 [Phytophthora capsici]|nr:hypothetical protein DVH05_014619 [Phytophthora capsici]